MSIVEDDSIHSILNRKGMLLTKSLERLEDQDLGWDSKSGFLKWHHWAELAAGELCPLSWPEDKDQEAAVPAVDSCISPSDALSREPEATAMPPSFWEHISSLSPEWKSWYKNC